MVISQASDLTITSLGSCHFPSPLRERDQQFVDDASWIVISSDIQELTPFLQTGQIPPAFEPAGPRADLFFDPATLTSASLPVEASAQA
jgi:hypothetical protein